MRFEHARRDRCRVAAARFPLHHHRDHGRIRETRGRAIRVRGGRYDQPTS